jgi:hypothetical protein
MGKDKTSSILESVGHELKVNPPKVLQSTEHKFGIARAKRQKRAILLSKARKTGANVPYKGA